MPKYKIREREVHIQEHTIEAASKQEAIQIYHEDHCSCNCENIKPPRFSHSLDLRDDDIDEVTDA